MAALFVGVIEIGNLIQSGDNAQNAADSAALAAAGSLINQAYGPAADPPTPMVVNSLPIQCYSLTTNRFMSCQCQIGSGNTISHCSNYSWLTGYSIYWIDQWKDIGSQVSQVSPASAINHASGSWTCSLQSRRHDCLQLDVNPTVQGNGVDASLSDGVTISVAATATDEAKSVATNYGFTTYSGCTPPFGFLLAEGSSGVNCIGYDAAGTIWVGVPSSAVGPGTGSATDAKSSWATVSNGTAVLCPGPPPSGVCT